MEVNKKGLTAATLKMIAVISMFIDHIAAALIRRWEIEGGVLQTVIAGSFTYENLYVVLKTLGRFAFPVYCYFIVEGFYYTKSKAKYALRLFIFALISELPFDWAFSTFPAITEKGIINLMPEFNHQNVFFTFLIGLLCMWVVDEIRKLLHKMLSDNKIIRSILRGISFIGIFLASTEIALALHTDYASVGMLAIFVMYAIYLPHGRDTELVKWRRLLAFGMGCVAMLLSSSLEIYSFLMLIPMYFYNGQRGKQNKYFFYAFYPVHILILAIIGMLLNSYAW